ncbi:MAG: hypothetical protein ACTSXD_03345 [Candidatus Heimdallarchaeaceae archaeon]
MRVQYKKKFVLLIAMLFFTSILISNSNEAYSGVKQEGVNTINTDFSFYFISPENNSIYDEDITLSYSASELSASLTFYLNDSVISDIQNNTILPLTRRGKYNLTGVASFNNTEITETVIFSFYPIVNADFSYNAIFLNNWDSHTGASNHPTPCYKHDDPVVLQFKINELNDTFTLNASYEALVGPSYTTYNLGPTNITWIDTCTFSILINPLSENFTVHRVRLDINSSLPNGANTILFYFYRAINPPTVQPDIYANFVGETHSGQVQGNFEVWRSISNFTSIFVYLDGEEILSYEENNIDDFTGLLTISIDTTKYTNGVHTLEIIVTDFFNLTSFNTYSLTFNNEIIPTNGTPTNTSFPISYLLGIVMLTVVITTFKRKKN